MESDHEALVQVFLAETLEHLDEIEGALLELESKPDDRRLLERIFQIAHTLKGNATAVGLHALGELGHAAEDVIESLYRGMMPVARATISILLETVDEARRMLPSLTDGTSGKAFSNSDLLRKLEGARCVREEAIAAPPSVSRPAEDENDKPGNARTIRVAVQKLDRMADLIGEITISRNRIARTTQTLHGGAGAALLDDIGHMERLHCELEEMLRRARMVPVGPWLRQYERSVRDLAQAHGKSARLVVLHGDVEVDAAVIERLRDALTHAVRNSVDHGIEMPEVRRARGKDPRGTITLRASHEAGGITLWIADDGAGMNRARIAARARASGSCSDPASLSDDELFELVCQPGFSTAAEVSEISGRGMGMDVVKRRIESLHGMIRIESSEGAGTTICLTIPLTLATIEGFSVSVGDERYVVPLRAVVACFELPRDGFGRGSRGVTQVRGQTLPCLRLRELFQLGGATPSKESVLVVAYKGGQGGLVVDTLEGESRTVIKPLDRLFRRVAGVSGSTILGDGRVALILDMDTLFDHFTRGSREVYPARAAAPDVRKV